MRQDRDRVIGRKAIRATPVVLEIQKKKKAEKEIEAQSSPEIIEREARETGGTSKSGQQAGVSGTQIGDRAHDEAEHQHGEETSTGTGRGKRKRRRRRRGS